MSVRFHLVDAAAVIERQESQHLNAKEMALHLSVAQIMASLAWVQHHTEKVRVVASDYELHTFGRPSRVSTLWPVENRSGLV